MLYYAYLVVLAAITGTTYLLTTWQTTCVVAGAIILISNLGFRLLFSFLSLFNAGGDMPSGLSAFLWFRRILGVALIAAPYFIGLLF